MILPDARRGGTVPRCACGTPLAFATWDGYLYEWCAACRREAPVPLVGKRRYPQTADHVALLRAGVARARRRLPAIKRKPGSLGSAKGPHLWKGA